MNSVTLKRRDLYPQGPLTLMIQAFASKLIGPLSLELCQWDAERNYCFYVPIADNSK